MGVAFVARCRRVAATYGLACVLVSCALVCTTALAQPPMMDPRQMSGIGRADPQVPAGTLTVRCLLGGFSEPAVGVKVRLELSAADGRKATREATTVEQGRATFDGLEAFAGGTAVAEAQLAGERVRSQAIALRSEMGSRVMLVSGSSSVAPATPSAAPSATAPAQAGAAVHGDPGAPQGMAGGADPHGAASPHGNTGFPEPGQAFPLAQREAGTVVIGTLDLVARAPVPNVEVTLELVSPSGQRSALKLRSDEQGRAVFEGLLPPKVEAGTTIVASAEVEGERLQSSPFELGDVAMAVVLAKMQAHADASATADDGAEPAPAAGAGDAHGQAAGAPHAARQQASRLPGPRPEPTLAAGTVRVRVVDGHDRVVAKQPVQVVKKDVTGIDVTFSAVTDSTGIATLDDVTVQDDAFYFVGVTYDGGPYQSSFFRMPPTTGVAVDVRVFPISADASKVKSAVRFQIEPRENDLIQVIAAYEVLVEGDAAFWPPGGMQLHGARGAKGLVVLDQSEAWLEHEESAPFARLVGPIVPGEVVRLSLGYLLDHDGEGHIAWAPPFPLVGANALVPEDVEVDGDGVERAEATQELDGFELYELAPQELGRTLEFVVRGLPVRPKGPRHAALAMLGMLGLAVSVALVTRRRTDARARLQVQRDQLLRMLDTATEAGERRTAIIVALDRIEHQLDALTPARAQRTASAPSDRSV